MARFSGQKWLLAAVLAGCAPLVGAHTFGRSYNLPVPVWMYVYGATAALALSFLIVAWFAHRPATVRVSAGPALPVPAALRHLRRLAQLGSVGALLLCIATGLWGVRNPYANFSMSAFWILFVLGYAWFTALVGNSWPWLNPWQLMVRGIARLWPPLDRGLIPYPRRLGAWPALALYMGFIWFELHAGAGPRGLGAVLAAYTLFNLAAGLLFGWRSWFTQGEFFGVFLRLLGSMAPLYRRSDGALALRWPGQGLLSERPADMAGLLFILFMLSSTAYDGLRETAIWYRWFWADFYELVRFWAGTDQMAAYRRLQPLFAAWQTVALLISPLLYLLCYLGCLWLMRRLTRSAHSLRELALAFAPSLLPIVLVYHLTHYYTLFAGQSLRLVGLISDPFGWRWDLFGTVHWLRESWVPDAGFVWHSQVLLIVGGHVGSVYVAHIKALEIYGDRRRAAVSQLPMLALMMAFTAVGLWILAQPLQGR